jgi:hypothetical protein
VGFAEQHIHTQSGRKEECVSCKYIVATAARDQQEGGRKCSMSGGGGGQLPCGYIARIADRWLYMRTGKETAARGESR